MKIHQMRAFNELMVAKSVSEAARNLRRSQPSVSATIASLEEDLGMQLFERRNGRLLPVPEAEYLHKECSEILSRLETIGQNIRRIKAIESGHISIASMPGPSVFYLPGIIADQFASRPEVSCTVVSRSSDAVRQLMAAQHHDIGLADYERGMEEDTSLIRTTVFRFECLCAVPCDDNLAKAKAVTPKDLSSKPMGALYEDHSTYLATSQAFASRGCDMNVRFRAQYFLPILTYVERGLAYAIVDPIAAESYRIYSAGNKKLTFLPFKPAVSFEVALILPALRPASQITQHFVDYITGEFRRIGGRVRG
ncbi:MAG: LysR family transcriptional regulator [Pseudomonadota bacterium]